MAKKFSAASAAVSGWALIGREPVAVLVWSGVILFGLILPLVLLFLPMLDSILRLIQIVGPTTDPENPEVMSRAMELQARMGLVNLASMVLNVLVPVVIVAAVFRAVLAPEDRRGFYLRIGAAEGWMMLIYLVFLFGAYFAMFVAFVPALLLGGVGYFAMAAGGDTEAGAVVGVLMGLLGLLAGWGALLWALLRLSMALPMTFAGRSFLLFESWGLTRGQAPRLFGMVLLMGLTSAVFQLVVTTIMIAVAVFAGMGIVGRLQTARSAAEVLPLLWPFLAAAVPVAAVVQAVMITVAAAPFARAYQGLKGVEEVEAAV
ncbi:hypothetical protein [Caulobacter endophyticus]|uniref:hypothetical protein n=1 Tax=Caulobacter endophyticus TaxID=2172652 RepID=UPI0024100239|nr:hypothetical protein [Caulobacter endophyticus]MDG2529399.1 hypothetical protein [Caulobacter endophyticus]